MKYVYFLLLVLSFVFGGYLGSKLPARTVIREIPVTVTETQTKTVTKEVVKKTDGTVKERVVTKTEAKTKASPQPPKPAPQYRVGVLLPVASELRPPTVTVSRRLAGNVWLESQFDLRHKEILIGVSYEF